MKASQSSVSWKRGSSDSAREDKKGDNVVSLEDNCAVMREALLGSLSEQTNVVSDAGGVRVNIAEQDGEGFLEFLELSPNFNMIISQCNWHVKRNIVYRGEGWLRLNFCLETNTRFAFSNSDKFDLVGAECRIFHQPVGMDCLHYLNDHTPSACVTLSVKREYLTRFLKLQTADLGDPLRAFLNGVHDDFFFERYPLAPTMARVVTDMIQSSYRGSLRRLHFESKANELLCLAYDAAHFTEEYGVVPLKFSDQDRLGVYKARDIIDNSLQQPPSIPALAREVGTNRNKLAYGFKKWFGCTVFEYQLRARMEAAWNLLENTKLPLGDIADLVGYQHQGSFTAAFKNYFNVLPKSVRLARADSEGRVRK